MNSNDNFQDDVERLTMELAEFRDFTNTVLDAKDARTRRVADALKTVLSLFAEDDGSGIPIDNPWVADVVRAARRTLAETEQGNV